jgi:membrane-associated phospholipid phosphatase
MQASVTALATKPAAESRILADAGVRRSEWVILVFLVYAASIGRALPIAPSLQTRTVVVNLAILIVYGLLIRADAVRPRMITSVIRDWLPLAVIILAYREVGWFALPYPGHRLEMRWVAWDRAFLRGGAKAAIESLGPVLPSILEIAYALVYALGPFCLAVLYSSGRRKDADRFLFVFATAVLLTYAQLPLWPSEPPRTVFPGEDAPAYLTVFRRFNWWTLAGCGIHTGVFPSAHVAGAFAAACGMRRAAAAQRRVHALLFTVAALIALATVYGRYHYLVDAVAGLAMATLAVAFSHLLDARRDGTIAPHRILR